MLAVDAANAWLLAFSISALVVLAVCAGLRREARRTRLGERGTHASPKGRGFRRRAGALLAIGPVVGLAFAPSFGTLSVTIAFGAVVLAAVGLVADQSTKGNLLALIATLVAAGVAVAAGARFGPTGVDALDAILAFVLIVAVIRTTDGMGNLDGLSPGIGVAASAGLFALAAFAHQDGLAAVVIGFAAACIAFLAFNMRPASLFVGRAGRMVIGWTLAVGALAVQPVAGPWRSILTPAIVLGFLLLDVAVVAVSRLRYRRPIGEHRADHLVHRLGRLGWHTSEVAALIIGGQVLLAGIAVFTGRAVLPEWLGATAAALVLLAIGIEAGRARLERDPPPGLSRRAWVVVGLVLVGLVAAVLPTALVANHAADLMLDGKDAASHGLSAARDGDSITARASFAEAAHTFGEAKDQLESSVLTPGLAVPGVASNLRAARTLAEVGTDLARSGGDIAAAVDPDALEVVDGRLPLPEVAKITPALTEGASALTNALQRINTITHDPYLAPPVRDAIDKVHGQLAQAEREARHAAAAAKLAPALFGGDGNRTYLLVVQNNSESRATGGFIGEYGLITAVDGKLHVGDLSRLNVWNTALRALPDPTVAAPLDYLRRYAQYSPQTTLQNVNLSPDFPSVAQALMGLAAQGGEAAGLTNVDGVMAVDPAGLAALLRLTGAVDVDGWPTPIDAGNVADVALRDEYVLYPDDTGSRVDVLGNIAKAAVDKATSGTLGKPAEIAKVLGAAAHAGHLSLAFTRPEEQRLAEQLDVAQEMPSGRSDAFAVTTSNVGGNKIDYYLKRDVDYQVMLHPDGELNEAKADADVSVQLDNTAPDSGLPQIVIGPFDSRFTAGQSRSYISLYSPLSFRQASWDGQPVQVAPGRERDRNVYSIFENVYSKQTKAMTAKLDGDVKLHDGWYDLVVRQQPTINPDHLHVSVQVPKGWKIDQAPGMERLFAREASATMDLEKSTHFRVHLVRDVGNWDLWDRLEAGQ
jgi:UDP-N-acetylmuramyl pentapeptide phosphotransferase/UDP-N-acetylglucosamine-1-phosphate transferase